MILQNCSDVQSKRSETNLFLCRLFQIDFVLYWYFPWVSSRGYSLGFGTPFWLCLLKYLFNSPLLAGKSEYWSACPPAALWLRVLLLHLYLKCSCSLPRILGLWRPALGREEQLPWHYLWFSAKNFPHNLNEPRPLTAVTADLEPSALTHLADKGPSGKCPPYQKLALERVWMVVVHLGPPQSCHCRGSWWFLHWKLAPRAKSVWKPLFKNHS